MKPKFTLGLFLCIGMFLTACGTDGRYQVTLITEGNHRLMGTIDGDLLIFGGQATLEPGAILNGSAHIISGDFQLEGEIRGDLSILGGIVTSGPHARVDGDLNYGGGELSDLNSSAVGGELNTGTGIRIPPLETQPAQNPIGQLVRWIVNALILGLLAVLIERYLPGPAARTSEAALRHPFVSLAMGMLVGIVGVSLIVLLAYTILLIPVALLGLVLLGAAIIYGWISSGIALGHFVAPFLKIEISPRKIAFSSTFLFMLLLSIITAIPAIGGLIGIFVASLALGAVFLTRFGTRHFVPESSKMKLLD